MMEWVQTLGLETKLTMFVGYFMLVMWTLVAMAAVELKNKDFNRADFGPFLSVFLTYIAILGGLEAFQMAVNGVAGLEEVTQFAHLVGYGGAVFHCFRRLLDNLALLGLNIPGLRARVDQMDPGKGNEDVQEELAIEELVVEDEQKEERGEG